MPIYEYECTKCGAIQEAWQKMTDKPLKKCDKCSGKLQKLISQSTFHLKGSGWYATDYAAKSAGNEPAKEAKAEKKASEKKAAPADKPAAKKKEAKAN